MFNQIMEAISKWSIPLIILIIPTYALLIKKVKIYEVFCEGAKEGFTTAIRIIPFLVAMLFAIGILRASGVLSAMANLFQPVLSFIGMPGELLPMAILRPLSGGGARGVMADLITTHGPDSLIGYMSSVMMGSTDTTFYVLAVYFGAVGIKRIRHAIPAGLLADLAGIIAAVWVSNIMFR